MRKASSLYSAAVPLDFDRGILWQAFYPMINRVFYDGLQGHLGMC